MILKVSLLSIQDKNSIDLDNTNINDYPTLDDLMREQNILREKSKTVHHRRDLDSLG